MYVVEWFGNLYGPFTNEQAAAMFTPPVQHENGLARGVVRPLYRPPSDGERQSMAVGLMQHEDLKG